MTPGEFLKNFRERLGLSKYALAKNLNIYDYQWLAYERGKYVPSIRTCNKIIDYALTRGIKLTYEDILRPTN